MAAGMVQRTAALVTCLFLGIGVVTDAQSLTGVYDVEDIKMRAINFTRSSFVLTCNVSPSVPSTATVSWFKGDNPVSNTTLVNRYNIAKNETHATLTIKPVNENDNGTYSCRLADKPDDAAYFTVVGRPYVKLHPNHNVVEGQDIKMVCNVHGKPNPTVTWMYDNGTANITLTPTERLSFRDSEAGVKNALVVLVKAEPSDHGTYYCTAWQKTGDLSSIESTVLRVKDKYAALWPFIGICAEVVVLCVVILVYEKRRTKNTDMDDSDTDNHDTKKS